MNPRVVALALACRSRTLPPENLIQANSNQEAVNPMSIRLKYSLPALLQLSAVVFAASPAIAASWQTVSDYGASIKMTLYVPDKVDASPGVVVSLHYCGGNEGNGQAWFKSAADKYGFIVIAPKSQGSCWDAAPGRSGEEAAVVKMVEYVISKNNADKTKVFAAGASSGACMTNSLLASYPDVFAGGSVLAGVPAGGWTTRDQYDNLYKTAPDAKKDAKVWGDIVRSAFSFSGTRPRVQLWHGTSDELINYGWLAEEVKQWTNVMGLSTKSQGQPPSGWSQETYKDANGTVMLEVNTGSGKVHDLTQYNPWDAIVAFFGLDKDTPSSGGTGGAGGTSSTVASTGGKASVGGAGGTASSSKAVTAGGAGGAASSSKATGGAATTAAGGTSSKGESTSGKGGAQSSSKVSSKGGASAKGGASSIASEEGGAASSTDDQGAGGSDGETTTAQSKGGSTQKASSSKGDTSSQAKGGAAATTADTQQNQTPPDDGGGCNLSARDGRTSSGALAGLMAMLIGLASRRRRRAS